MVDHSDLHPDRLRADEYGLLDRFCSHRGATEYVDDVDRDSNLRELTPDKLAKHMLAGDLRIHRQHAIAPVLEEFHHAVGWAARAVRSADDRNRPCFREQLRNVFVTRERHIARTAQWTGVSTAFASSAARAANASASGPVEAASGFPASDASRMARDSGSRPRNGMPI